MIERDKGPTKTYGFLLAVELQPHASLDDVKFHLADAVAWKEGCGRVDVESLGELAVYEEPKVETIVYPCGCSATSNGPALLPNYCPDHGTINPNQKGHNQECINS